MQSKGRRKRDSHIVEGQRKVRVKDILDSPTNLQLQVHNPHSTACLQTKGKEGVPQVQYLTLLKRHSAWKNLIESGYILRKARMIISKNQYWEMLLLLQLTKTSLLYRRFQNPLIHPKMYQKSIIESRLLQSPRELKINRMLLPSSQILTNAIMWVT
jgi:hypothetical protein